MKKMVIGIMMMMGLMGCLSEDIETSVDINNEYEVIVSVDDSSYTFFEGDRANQHTITEVELVVSEEVVKTVYINEIEVDKNSMIKLKEGTYEIKVIYFVKVSNKPDSNIMVRLKNIVVDSNTLVTIKGSTIIHKDII